MGHNNDEANVAVVTLNGNQRMHRVERAVQVHIKNLTNNFVDFQTAGGGFGRLMALEEISLKYGTKHICELFTFQFQKDTDQVRLIYVKE